MNPLQKIKEKSTKPWQKNDKLREQYEPITQIGANPQCSGCVSRSDVVSVVIFIRNLSKLNLADSDVASVVIFIRNLSKLNLVVIRNPSELVLV